MLGIVYKTTCLPNGKIYIGQTTHPEDKSYLGSGTKISDAIKRFGKKLFVRETLRECNTQKALDAWEYIYIKMYDSTNQEVGYNILPGTANNFGSVNPAKLERVKKTMSEKAKARGSNRTGKKHTEESKAKMKLARQKYKTLPPEWRAKVSEGLKRNKVNVGIKRSDEFKQKCSDTISSMYNSGRIAPISGKIWINDGNVNRHHNPSLPIPTGWYKGMIQ